MISVPRGSGISASGNIWRSGRFLIVFRVPGVSEVLKGLSGSTGGGSSCLEVFSVPLGGVMCRSVCVCRFGDEAALTSLGSGLLSLSPSSLSCVSSNCSSRLVRSGASIPDSPTALCSLQPSLGDGGGSSGGEILEGTSGDVSFTGVGVFREVGG